VLTKPCSPHRPADDPPAFEPGTRRAAKFTKNFRRSNGGTTGPAGDPWYAAHRAESQTKHVAGAAEQPGVVPATPPMAKGVSSHALHRRPAACARDKRSVGATGPFRRDFRVGACNAAESTKRQSRCPSGAENQSLGELVRGRAAEHAPSTTATQARWKPRSEYTSGSPAAVRQRLRAAARLDDGFAHPPGRRVGLCRGGRRKTCVVRRKSRRRWARKRAVTWTSG